MKLSKIGYPLLIILLIIAVTQSNDKWRPDSINTRSASLLQDNTPPFVPDLNGYTYVFRTDELKMYSGELVSDRSKRKPAMFVQKKEQHPWVQIIDGEDIYWMNLEAPEFVYRKYVE